MRSSLVALALLVVLSLAFAQAAALRVQHAARASARAPTRVSAAASPTAAAELPVFAVTAYGAVGDGVTDCTPALTAAAAALRASPTGGSIYFAAGDWLLQPAHRPDGVPTRWLLSLYHVGAVYANVSYTVGGAGAEHTRLIINATGTEEAFLYAEAGNGTYSPTNLEWASLALKDFTLTTHVDAHQPRPSIDGVIALGFAAVEVSGVHVVDAVFDEALAINIGSESVHVAHCVFNNSGTTALVIGNHIADAQITDTVVMNSAACDSPTLGVSVDASSNLLLRNVVLAGLDTGLLGADSTYDGRASNVTLIKVQFVDVQVGVQVPGDNTLVLSACSFDNSDLDVDPRHGNGTGVGVQVASFADYSVPASVQIDDTTFKNFACAVNVTTGSVLVSKASFEHCAVGVLYQYDAHWQQSATPLTLSHSSFHSVRTPASLQGQTGFVVTDNNCDRHCGPIELGVCAVNGAQCTVAKNKNCKTDPRERISVQ